MYKKKKIDGIFSNSLLCFSYFWLITSLVISLVIQDQKDTKNGWLLKKMSKLFRQTTNIMKLILLSRKGHGDVTFANLDYTREIIFWQVYPTQMVNQMLGQGTLPWSGIDNKMVQCEQNMIRNARDRYTMELICEADMLLRNWQ